MSDTPVQEPEQDTPKSASWTISVVLCVVILLAAGGLAALTYLTEPTAQKSGATKKTAMLVEVVDAERGDYRPQIVAQGTVEPAQDIVLSSQVGGRITALDPAFTPGGFVEQGDLLLRIETADFEHALAQRKSELRQARSQLAVEKGLHEAAQAEYEYIGEDLSPENKALVLRKPQLEAIQEQVNAARAAVEQAELDLSRATVEAPFDAHILSRDVNVGSQVAMGQNLGRLVGIDTYWVNIELPLSKLRWVSVASDQPASNQPASDQPTGNKQAGARVQVRNSQSWPEDTYRSGYLFRLVGALDQNTRMARVLAAIPDPLARQPLAPQPLDSDSSSDDANRKPPLMIGEFVEATIQGNQIEDVVRLNRDYVRKDDTVWVMADGKLEIRDVAIAVRDAKYAYIADGLAEGDQIVTTNLSTVVEGSPLRLEGASDE